MPSEPAHAHAGPRAPRHARHEPQHAQRPITTRRPATQAPSTHRMRLARPIAPHRSNATPYTAASLECQLTRRSNAVEVNASADAASPAPKSHTAVAASPRTSPLAPNPTIPIGATHNTIARPRGLAKRLRYARYTTTMHVEVCTKTATQYCHSVGDGDCGRAAGSHARTITRLP